MRQLIPLVLLATLLVAACSAAGPDAGPAADTDQVANAITVYQSPT